MSEVTPGASAPARSGSTGGSSVAEAILAVAQKRTVAFAPGTVAGTALYLHTGRFWQALLLGV